VKKSTPTQTDTTEYAGNASGESVPNGTTQNQHQTYPIEQLFKATGVRHQPGRGITREQAAELGLETDEKDCQ